MPGASKPCFFACSTNEETCRTDQALPARSVAGQAMTRLVLRCRKKST
jgi:hypothetical protein